MKNWISLSTVAALIIAFVTIRPGYSDDSTKSSKQAEAKKQTTKSAAGKTTAGKTTASKTTASKPKAKQKPKGRLPNYYAQIGISKQQREEIYSIQNKFSPQLLELKKQMAALVAKREAEIQAVLTEAQREDLTKAREESKKRALERIKKAAAERAKQKTAKTTKSE